MTTMLRKYENVLWMLGMFVCTVVAVVISVQASERAIRQSEQRQCAGLLAELRTYEEKPPPTETGKALQQTKRELYRINQCPGGTTP